MCGYKPRKQIWYTCGLECWLLKFDQYSLHVDCILVHIFICFVFLIFFFAYLCRVPWFHYPIIYDIRSRPRKISSPTGSKGKQSDGCLWNLNHSTLFDTFFTRVKTVCINHDSKDIKMSQQSFTWLCFQFFFSCWQLVCCCHGQGFKLWHIRFDQEEICTSVSRGKILTCNPVGFRIDT